MSLQIRISKLESYRRQHYKRVPVELLSDAELEAMSKECGYDMSLLTDEELNALRDCYADTGEFIPARFTPELEAAMQRVKQ